MRVAATARTVARDMVLTGVFLGGGGFLVLAVLGVIAPPEGSGDGAELLSRLFLGAMGLLCVTLGVVCGRRLFITLCERQG